MVSRKQFFRTVVGVALGLGIVYCSTALTAFLPLNLGDNLGFFVWLLFQLVGFMIILTSLLACYAEYITSRNRQMRDTQ